MGPGESRRIKFKAQDPGAFIYHCAVPDPDYHISSGMFGIILVEPKDGLPAVDQEYYFGQNEMYVKDPKDENTPGSSILINYWTKTRDMWCSMVLSTP